MLEINDRVRLIKDHPAGNFRLGIGDEGTVVNLGNIYGDIWVGVRFDMYIYGHDCYGRCETGYGWNVPIDTLEKVDQEDYDSACSDEEFLSFICGGSHNG